MLWLTGAMSSEQSITVPHMPSLTTASHLRRCSLLVRVQRFRLWLPDCLPSSKRNLERAARTFTTPPKGTLPEERLSRRWRNSETLDLLIAAPKRQAGVMPNVGTKETKETKKANRSQTAKDLLRSFVATAKD